jgi:hypothetical protein
MRVLKTVSAFACFLALGACMMDPAVYGPTPAPYSPPKPHGPGRASPHVPAVPDGRAHQVFFEAIRAHCGRAFEGRVTTSDPEDQAMRRTRLVLDVRSCNPREIRMPFHQGDNRSRTWVLSQAGGRLALRHDHRQRNGKPEDVTLYGGETIAPGTVARQEFPADAYSSELFFAKGREESAQNIWALEVVPGRTIAYELRRTGRYLRIEFDLRRPLGPQPAPWGGR